MSANIRFLLFPSGKDFSKTFCVTSTFQSVKNSLFEEWPTHLQPLTSLDDLRLVHSGKMIEDEQTIKDVFKFRDDDPNPSATVHIAIKRPVTPVAPSVAPQEAPADNPDDVEIHYHFCCVDEEEVNMLTAIYNRKKGQDSKISFTEVEKFLRSYWQWMKRSNLKSNDDSFPDSELNSLRTKILGSSDRLTEDQFRQFFYLFDNHLGTETHCPHGEKMRAKMAAQTLHQSIKPGSEFPTDVFENVFEAIDRDADGVLTCKELELLYYTYSTRIMTETEAQ